MRPDEHKKKKNAAYKKKHGIGQSKAGQSEEKPKQRRGEQGKDSSHLRKNTGREARECKDGTAQKKDQAQADFSSSDSETEEVRQPRKTFQRRQIVSNWQKYELQPEDEGKQEAKGESFEKLLSMSGDAVAHFRFKDEQEWDVVEALEDSKISDDHYTQYLNIDTQRIGEAMNCLPLYKVLGLNPELFPNDERELMEKTAVEKRQTLMPGQSTSSLSMTLFSSSGNAVCDDNENLKRDDEIHTKFNATDNEPVVCPDLTGSSLTGESQPNTMSNNIREQAPTTTAISSTVNRLVLQDEDLDSLLDLDTPGVTYDTSSIKLNPKSHPSDELDKLSTSQGVHPGPTTESPGAKPPQTSQETLETEPTKDGVDLEDWLDSILDD